VKLDDVICPARGAGATEELTCADQHSFGVRYPLSVLLAELRSDGQIDAREMRIDGARSRASLGRGVDDDERPPRVARAVERDAIMHGVNRERDRRAFHLQDVVDALMRRAGRVAENPVI